MIVKLKDLTFAIGQVFNEMRSPNFMIHTAQKGVDNLWYSNIYDGDVWVNVTKGNTYTEAKAKAEAWVKHEMESGN